ncbi:adenylyl-sulfate kinase [Echinicola jeungdonensis]|uniref:Adenylyl-sulfate kinase n=1 Tax=Echinicola jeungdonensis TaxID=709343 RepID=A0ABV5J864_9BACT|nr:adenylyl-sulfate kinase [Echinicola jeungdonensis]MDN3669271.1 adenylyl-sulfate kinase [Echinicola jeungdonensis]
MSKNQVNNVFHQDFKIKPIDRQKRLNQKPLLIWFTGLSGSGKSTLANGTEQRLFQNGYHTFLLDGDNIRKGLNKDLGFEKEDRNENLRRIAEVAKLMMEAGLIVVAAFISPYRKEREMIKELVGEDRFLEIFVDCPLEECEERDVKGLYQKARKGLIKNFTGIDAPYEAPQKPFLQLPTSDWSKEECLDKIIGSIKEKITWIA